MRKKEKPWSVNEIVAAEYCEQKAVFERQYGDRPSPKIHQARKRGDLDHKSFERQGYRQQARQDRRCFIASAVFGSEAPQTDFLRSWRDQALIPTVLGRALVKLYYRTSPPLACLITIIPGCSQLVRRLLKVFIRLVGGGRL